MNTDSTSQKILGWVKILFTPVALAFLFYFAWQAKDELATILSEASLLLLVLASLAWCLFNAVTPLLAVTLLNACGSKIGLWQAFAIHASRLPARYEPGGIWHTVGRVMDYNQQGVQARHLTAFVVLENGFAATVALAIGGAVVFFTRGPDTLGMIAALSSAGSVVALAIIRTVINGRILQQPDRISLLAYAAGIGLMVVIWMIATTAFLLYLNAFPASTGDHSQVEMGGIYLFSWGIGFLAVFAPQGIGVFEFISSELMGSPIGFMGLAALVGGFRITVLVADLTVWMLYQILRQWFDGQSNTTAL